MTFSYLYGFLDPDGKVRDLPVGLVIEDTGATVGGRDFFYGELVATSLTDPLQETVAWVLLHDREAALAEFGDNNLVAVLVVPAGYSASIVRAR